MQVKNSSMDSKKTAETQDGSGEYLPKASHCSGKEIWLNGIMFLKNVLTRFWPQLVIFFGLLFFLLLCSLGLRAPALYSGVDDMITVGSGAYLAGIDWTPFMEQFQFYYGGGFTFLMSPVLWFFQDMVIGHHILLLYNGIALGFCGLLCFSLLKRYFSVQSTSLCILISLACTGLPFTFINAFILWNETIMLLMLWLMIYLLVSSYYCAKDRKKVLLNTILLAVVFLFSMLVHTRTLFFLIGIVAAVVLCGILEKRIIVHIPLAIFLFIAVFIAATQLSKVFQSMMYSSSAGTTMVYNTVEDAGSIFGQIKDFIVNCSWEKVASFLSGMLGKFFSTFSLSFSMVAFALVLSIFLIFRPLKSHMGSHNEIQAKQALNKKEEMIEKSVSVIQEQGDAEENEENEKELNRLGAMRMLACFLLVIFLTIVCAFSLRSIDAVNAGFEQGLASKFLAYFRYQAAVIGPMQLLVFLYFYFRYQRKTKILWIGIGLSVVTTVLFALLYGAYYNGTLALASLENFIYFPFSGSGEIGVMSSNTMMIHGLVTVGVGVGLLILFYKNKIRVASILLISLAAYFFIYSVCIFFLPQSIYAYQKVDKIVAAMMEVEKNAGHQLPSKVYTVTQEQFPYKYLSTLQFMLPRITQYPMQGLSKQEYKELLNSDEYLILSDAPLISHDMLMADTSDYAMAVLDEGEYLYLKGSRWMDLMRRNGIDLQHIDTDLPGGL